MAFEDITYGPYDNSERKAQKAYELYEDGKISQAIVELEAAIEITRRVAHCTSTRRSTRLHQPVRGAITNTRRPVTQPM